MPDQEEPEESEVQPETAAEAAPEPTSEDAPTDAEPTADASPAPKRKRSARAKRPAEGEAQPSAEGEPTAEADSEPSPNGEPPTEGQSDESAEPDLPIDLSGGVALKRVCEALVFASPKPITTKEIVAALKAAAASSEDAHVQALGKCKAHHVLEALAEVQAELEATDRAFQLVEKISGWVLVSDPLCADWVRKLYPEAKPTRLTGPQLETLAIIAYRQPVTRADIEAVRGVSVDGVMQVLLDRSLVKIAGRAEVPGRPLLYSTTEYFLEHFGLKNTDELPNSTELKRVVLPTAPIPEEPATTEAASVEMPPADAAEAPASTGEPAPTEDSEGAAEEPSPDDEAEPEETIVADEMPEPEPADEPPAEPRD
ncbi:MAG: SMC-Scp complex subunit ScpB [Chthoniobacteraceae bacterium]